MGQDYYLAVSSFACFPALPVYHSRDLVNWEHAGNAQSFGDSLDLSEAGEEGGVWAPTLRWHDDMFFIAVSVETRAGEFANLLLHAREASGPWSVPVRVDVGGIDPSLFFEDGKAYVCTNDRLGSREEGICLGVVDPMTGKILEPFRRIFSGTGGGWLEAPHIYHVNEWYWLLCAEGGTGMGHMAVVARAASIWGPYESCLFMTNRNDTEKQACCCGHGDLVEDTQGNWWMVHLGVRPGILSQSQLGRETFLTPVTWENGWPRIRDNRARIREEGPLTVPQKPWQDFADDFSEPDWPLPWCFVRNPDLKHFRRGDGVLAVTPAPAEPSASAFPGLVCVRQRDFTFDMSVSLAARSLAENVSGGLMVMANHMFWFFFGVRRDEKGLHLFLKRRADDMETCRDFGSLEGDMIRLTIRGTREAYSCFVSPVLKEQDSREVCRVSARLFSQGVTRRGFTGAMAGLYAASQGPAQAVCFRHFEMTNPEREQTGQG